MAAAQLMQWVGKKDEVAGVELHSVSHSASPWSLPRHDRRAEEVLSAELGR
jgi:uncharacterized phage-associated protein